MSVHVLCECAGGAVSCVLCVAEGMGFGCTLCMCARVLVVFT